MGGNGLIIFDCDGVLVDSEPISIEVLRQTIAAAGVEISETRAYELFLGRSMASIRAVIASETGVAIGDDALAGLRKVLFRRFSEELKPIPGIGETLAGLGDRRRCVASSSQIERIRFTLGLTGLIDYFGEDIFSASMVANGKPAPDLFLHAARLMGAEPAACVVIEDSPAGIQAARSAGMRVFAFAGGLHAAAGRLREAFAALAPDAIFDDMRRLPALLDRHAA